MSKVTALHAGEYQCLGSTGTEVFNTIRLYTLDGKSEKCQSKAKEVRHLLFCPRISSHVCLNSCFRAQARRIQPHTILRAHVRSKMWSRLWLNLVRKRWKSHAERFSEWEQHPQEQCGFLSFVCGIGWVNLLSASRGRCGEVKEVAHHYW